jgi:hypothetical protein
MKRSHLAVAALLGMATAGGFAVKPAHADLIHRYDFSGTIAAGGTVSDLVGTANGLLVNSATVSGGSLQLNNAPFSGPSTAGGYLSLPAGILPSSGSATIETWFTFGGSGFFTEAYTFTNSANDTNPPGANNGQYLMGTISAPQPGTPPGGANTGGSHIAQSLAGYAGGEIDAYETTPGVGAGGGGYLDDGETFMMAMTIDSTGNLSYYLYDLSQGGIGGLQQTVAGNPLSAFAFTNAFLGRSAFPGDNSTNGTIDEFRVYNTALSASQIAADEAAGPNVVVTPEPASLSIAAIGAAALVSRRRRK